MPAAGCSAGCTNTAVMRLRLMLAAALLAGALAVSACGSSTTVTTTVTGGSSTAADTTSSSAASSSSTTGTVTSTATAARAPLCRAATLSLSFLGQQGATGHGELGFALRNTGSTSCHTFGYPGILFLGRTGQPLPTTPTHSTRTLFGVTPLAGLTVKPGASVSFRLEVTHGINSTVGCGTAYGLQAIPPNDTGTLRTTIPSGAYQCRTAVVSPVRPGTSAFP
jgi:hypothetical protein